MRLSSCTMSDSDAQSIGSAREFTTDDYFKTQSPPAGLEEKTKRMHDFIQKWAAVPDKRLVVVTVSEQRRPSHSR